MPGVDELKAAGLLDASPAINAYRATAGDFNPGEAAEEVEPSGDVDYQLPQDALSAVREEAVEPLDPDDDF